MFVYTSVNNSVKKITLPYTDDRMDVHDMTG